MKTKIGEKGTKISNVKDLLKAYPGIGVIAAALVIGGVGFGAMTLADTTGETEVPETKDPIVSEQEENKEQVEEPVEVVAKTIDEAAEEIVSAGAESVEFKAEDEGMIVDVVLSAEASEEDVNDVNDAVQALLKDDAFVKANLFENAEERITKNYTVNYILGEGEPAYKTTAGYYASSGRNGWIYTCNVAWSGPEAVEVEEDVPVASTTPATPAPSTTPSAPATTPSTGNNTTGTTTPATQESTTTTPPAEETPTQNEITPVENENNRPEGSLSAKAEKLHNNTNSDVIGWLQIPGTNIDYAVTCTTNNDYYMNHDIYKQSSKNGALVADYECNFDGGLPKNTIIYGHNWNNCYAPIKINNPNHVMFEQLHSYVDADFAANHPYIYFSTTEGDYKYQVFAAFYTHINWTDYIYAYPDSAKFSNVVSTAKQKSEHNFGVSVSGSDKIISLSTCTRMMGNTNQYRFVVMAKLVG